MRNVNIPTECDNWLMCYVSNTPESCNTCFPLPGEHFTAQGGVGLILHSLYATKVQHYFKYFPRENFLFIRFEDFEDYGSPHVINRVCDWLGIERMDDIIEEKLNVNKYPPMKESTEKFLRQFFKQPNEQFYEVIGKNYMWGV